MTTDAPPVGSREGARAPNSSARGPVPADPGPPQPIGGPARLIEVLGPGCPRCDRATKDVAAVVDRMRIDALVVHVTDPAAIVGYGLLFDVPGIAVDGVLVSRGRVPSQREIERWLAPQGSL